nr:MAG TPA: hypothetical protein [Caudoviricetes sp.]
MGDNSNDTSRYSHLAVNWENANSFLLYNNDNNSKTGMWFSIGA